MNAAMKRPSRMSILPVSCLLVLGCLQGGCASEAVYAQPPPPPEPLVAPIALYPDPLVAQILAAATHPKEIVEADRWLQQHPDLKGDLG
jgi:Protein of unknown function (DUF3300)